MALFLLQSFPEPGQATFFLADVSGTVVAHLQARVVEFPDRKLLLEVPKLRLQELNIPFHDDSCTRDQHVVNMTIHEIPLRTLPERT